MRDARVGVDRECVVDLWDLIVVVGGGGGVGGRFMGYRGVGGDAEDRVFRWRWEGEKPDCVTEFEGKAGEHCGWERGGIEW